MFQTENVYKGKLHPLCVHINSINKCTAHATSRKQIQRNMSLLYNLLILSSRYYQLKNGRKTQFKNTPIMCYYRITPFTAT